MSLSIIDTLQDKKLLGQFLKDFKTWKAWFCFLRAFFALSPARGDKDLYRQCTGRSEWPENPSKEAWLIIGTRGGKSFITALIATFLAVFREYKLSPGEKGYILIVAPTKRQSSIIKRYLSGFFNQNIFLQPYLVRETSEEVELSNNIIIAVLSSDYRSLRGFTAIACIVDEVAYLSIEGSKPDTEVVRALRTRLMSTRGPLISISSPYAKRGSLYDVYSRHYGQDGSHILVWQGSSLLMNPTLDEEAIREASIEDPEGALADYEARFREDISSLFSPEAIDRVCTLTGTLAYNSRNSYLAFCDPSGGRNDAFTLAIGNKTKDKFIVDLLRAWDPPFNPEKVVEDIVETLREYHVTRIVGDRYSAGWVEGAFQKYSIRYDPCEKNKSELYLSMEGYVNTEAVELPNEPKLIRELKGLERRRGKSGKDVVDHPLRGTDDRANSVAGLLHLLSGGKQDLIFPELLLQREKQNVQV